MMVHVWVEIHTRVDVRGGGLAPDIRARGSFDGE